MKPMTASRGGQLSILGVGWPGEFVLLASWSSEAAMRDHYDSTHYRHYCERVGPTAPSGNPRPSARPRAHRPGS
jgi:Antibiotic biosynthesis monooxygenase